MPENHYPNLVRIQFLTVAITKTKAKGVFISSLSNLFLGITFFGI